ncbi:MAG: DUF2141 domain-containing protein [Pseudomonadota bacterium]
MKVAVVGAILLLAFTGMARAEGGTGSITVDLSGFRNDNGRASVVLYNGPEAFPKQADKAQQIVRSSIKDKKAQTVFTNIPFGTYAFVVLHDENGNGKMDYNALGMPQEGYAFSNNAQGVLGPPDYKDAAFKIDKPALTQTIKIGY